MDIRKLERITFFGLKFNSFLDFSPAGQIGQPLFSKLIKIQVDGNFPKASLGEPKVLPDGKNIHLKRIGIMSGVSPGRSGGGL